MICSSFSSEQHCRGEGPSPGSHEGRFHHGCQVSAVMDFFSCTAVSCHLQIVSHQRRVGMDDGNSLLKMKIWKTIAYSKWEKKKDACLCFQLTHSEIVYLEIQLTFYLMLYIWMNWGSERMITFCRSTLAVMCLLIKQTWKHWWFASSLARRRIQAYTWPKGLQKKVGLTLLGFGQHMRLADGKNLRDRKKSVYSKEEF